MDDEKIKTNKISCNYFLVKSKAWGARVVADFSGRTKRAQDDGPLCGWMQKLADFPPQKCSMRLPEVVIKVFEPKDCLWEAGRGEIIVVAVGAEWAH